MSKRCSPTDFKGMLDKWTSAFTPVSARQLDLWHADFEDAHGSLHYMNITKLEPSPPMERMLSYRGGIHSQRGILDIVKVDLERIWNLDLASGLTSYHSFLDRLNGFEYRFMAVNGSNEYMTGRLVVVDRPKD